MSSRVYVGMCLYFRRRFLVRRTRHDKRKRITMSAICQNFVQNAWKKDLCSNCFKSKDEHNQVKTKVTPVALSKSAVPGIIKSSNKAKPRRSVEFTKQLTEVIGYGGEDWSSDVDEPKDDESSDDEDVDFVEDEDKELQRITKANTDFNTSSMLETADMKKSYTQLMLGKPQVDSEGRKQTLLVSVTPFGQETINGGKKFSKSISHIPIAKTSKDTFSDGKGGVVLTSYTRNNSLETEEKSLLDEISETLESSKNPIQIISRKKTQKEVVLTKLEVKSNKENVEQGVKNENLSENRNSEKATDPKAMKTSSPERKNGLTRTSAIKRDQEKPVIYQTSTAKIELMNNKNLKLSSSKENLTGRLKADTVNQTIKNEQKPLEAMEVAKENIAVVENSIETKKVTPPELTSGICHDTPKEQSETSDESIISTSSEDSMKDEDNKESDTPLPTLESTPADKIINMSPKAYNISMPQSRELAGEPDGRADPETHEPPALPLTPPPNLDTHTSFLHNNIKSCEKPKVPSKPATILIRKPTTSGHNVETQNQQTILSTFASENKGQEQKYKLQKQDSNGSDIYRASNNINNSNNNKRRAPKPPSSEDLSPIYARTMMNGVGSESPVTKDRRERAASCSPKMSMICDNPQGEMMPIVNTVLPEPVPRHSLSFSTDNLVSGAAEEKKKEKRGRFSLKKFLRMGSSKDLPKVSNEVAKIEETDCLPQPRPRLVIVHPLELNGAKVEVVAKHDQVDHCNTNGTKQNEYMTPNVIPNGHDGAQQRATKPPPPPRHYDDWNYSKPNLPHPPKSQEILIKQKEFVGNAHSSKKMETVYANIGEVRCAITPHKPQRTASMREREAQQQQKRLANNYEPVNVQQHKDANENVYDYITNARSSSPECDSNKNSPTSKAIRLQNGFSQRSESNMDVSSEYFKYHNIPRSVSLTYCGSETESEIYSPYSFYGSESEIAEDDHEWTIPGSKPHKLRSRKGRSIVHKNLEDNYGAVVVANHEALAQVLDNIQQTVTIQPALRGLKTSSNLRWNDFSIKGGMQSVTIGPRAFHQAMWGNHHVTLVISTGPVPTSTLSLGTFSLVPVTEFSDLIPVKYLPGKNSEDVKYVQASVAVFPWMQVNSIQSYGEMLKTKAMQNNEDSWKDASFILLQLVNALKTLQAQGIEELPLLLTSFVLCREVDKDSYSKLYVLQGLGEDITRKKDEDKFGTLCMCASKALLHLQSSHKLSNLIQSLLSNERAVSLTQVKSVLEFSLWGPTDVTLGSTVRERELALQRWLDLQRATVLHGLVCTKIHLTVYEEYHLLFLVRSNSRMICDATLLLESSSLHNSLVGNHAQK